MKENKENIVWIQNRFEELEVKSLYSILQLRSAVFVAEQNSPYQDVDGKDQIATHLQGFYNNRLVSYCRLFKSGDYLPDASIGRVVVATEYRTFGFGHQLIEKAIQLLNEEFGADNITISAQLYLKRFYENHGFEKTSDEYFEDNIPHIRMTRFKLVDK